jgi:hypothetical protein
MILKGGEWRVKHRKRLSKNFFQQFSISTRTGLTKSPLQLQLWETAFRVLIWPNKALTWIQPAQLINIVG